MLKGIIIDVNIHQSTAGKNDKKLLAGRTLFIAHLKEQGLQAVHTCHTENKGKLTVFKEILMEWEITKEECLVIMDDDTSILTAKKAGFAVAGFEAVNENREKIKNAHYVLEGFPEADFSFFNKIWARELGLPLTILETERCYIREMTLNDLNDLYELYRDPVITEFTEDLYKDKEQEAAFIKAYIENQYLFYDYGMWLVFDKRTDKLIGRAGLEFREDFKDLELGYLIGADSRRKGYAFEVCRAILDYARAELECKSLHLFTHIQNIPSKKLCAKLGFQYKKEVSLNHKVMEMYELKCDI